VEILPLSRFDGVVKGMIEARDLVKAIGEALRKVVRFKAAHRNWRRLMSSVSSVAELGVTDPKVLKVLDAHEELENVGQ
jgi:hypothetical protein